MTTENNTGDKSRGETGALGASGGGFDPRIPYQEKIESCPFCGGADPDVCEVPEREDGGSYWVVMCAYCDAEGPPGWDTPHYYKTEELISTKDCAIRAWNRRAE